jgi:hypothetical protein
LNVAPRPAWLKPALIGVTVLGLIAAAPTLLAMMLSRPGDLFVGFSASGLLAFAGIWLVPVVGFLGLVLGWYGFGTGRWALARNGLLLAIVPIGLEIAAVAYVMHIADKAGH